MRKMEFCRKTIDLRGSKVEVVYYVTVDELFDSMGVAVSEGYGAGICVPSNGDEDWIANITLDMRKISEVVGILAGGTVTPVAMRDVLYDVLDTVI